MISIRPTQKVGSEKPRIEPAMMARPAIAVGLEAGAQAERDAEHDRDAACATRASSSVAGSRSRISSSAGTL